MRYPSNILEEELKNKVATDFFHKYNCDDIIKYIDFAVKAKGIGYLLWAEAKKNATDIVAMLAQLVLTIGKARTFNEVLPPKFLGCFDCEKIAFIPYSDIQDILHQNDFNWNVTPSNRESKEFKQIYAQINKIINSTEPHKTYCFDFEKDEKSLKLFILKNFMPGGEISKIRIDKNNFISVYSKWLEAVKPTIAVNWAAAKKIGIIDGDFYLADLLSRENKTLKEKLFVLLKTDYYELDQKLDDSGFFSSKKADFTDKQKAHNAFWAIYERPPREDYWDYIIERRDLLVPQDVRERKGSFFTPKIWVELSQKYIADVLGENWQEEYYVWDCAAGTGNLLAGLTNKYNVWASTLDKADVDVMHDRIENGANLLKEHCFQFDFLNDEFEKLPVGLRKIIDDPKKRKKLVVYINPPYAEATSTATRVGTKENKIGVATGNKTHIKYSDNMGKARNELFAQFIARIYFELHDCKIGEFSTQKALIAPNFKDFRKFFSAKLKKCFVVPADTFDNVKGQFPIGFKVWDTENGKHFKCAAVDVFDAKGNYIGKKTYQDGFGCKYINDWIKHFRDSVSIATVAKLCYVGNDFQNNTKVQICSPAKEIIAHDIVFNITQKNLIPASIYFAVRHCIEADWLNDRDQFLYPNDGWENDGEFQSDCLAYTLFHGQNNISCKHGTNHWIPFTEWDTSPRDRFDSHFMTDFIAGKIKFHRGVDLFAQNHADTNVPPSAAHPVIFLAKNATPLKEGNFEEGSFPSPRGVPALPAGCAAVGGAFKFSSVAKDVFKAGRELWKYYHAQPKSNANASLYDIREHFQGRNAQGKMNNKSDDEIYNELIGHLRAELKALAKKIEPKVYEHGFLKE